MILIGEHDSPFVRRVDIAPTLAFDGGLVLVERVAGEAYPDLVVPSDHPAPKAHSARRGEPDCSGGQPALHLRPQALQLGGMQPPSLNLAFFALSGRKLRW